MSLFQLFSVKPNSGQLKPEGVMSWRQKQKGMTFIEVLVAFIIISTGILGAVAIQAKAKQGSFDAMQRSLASSLAQDMIERMRSNQASNLFLEAYQGVYGETLNAVPDVRCNTAGVQCTPAQLVENDLYEWELSLMGQDITTANNLSAGGLVGGRGCIDHNQNAITVVVSWQGRVSTQDGVSVDGLDAATGAFVSGCGQSGDKRRQVVMTAFIN